MKSIKEAIASHAARAGHRVAVKDGGKPLSYAELHTKALTVERALRQRGVRHNDHVAIAQAKSAEAVIAVLGILYAGATVVLIDPQSPDDRRASILQQCSPCYILSEQPSDTDCRLNIAELLQKSAHAENEDTTILDESDIAPISHIACVIFVSGQDGVPKGIQKSQASIIAFFDSFHLHVPVGIADVFLNSAPLHLGPVWMDIFYPLYRGATVLLGPVLVLPQRLLRLIEESSATHFCAASFTLDLLADSPMYDTADLSSLRYIVTGGAALNPATVEKLTTRYDHLVVYNGYGATEAASICIGLGIDQGMRGAFKQYPIGFLHDGIIAYIDDGSGQGIGTMHTSGELLLAGAHLMDGYLGNPSSGFVDLDGVRFFRTGDIVRRDPDGYFHWLGRKDDQIKYMGHRISPMEIIKAIERIPGVSEARVLFLPDKADVAAIAALAFVETQADIEIMRSMRTNLKAMLPPYMIPKYLFLAKGDVLTAEERRDAACIDSIISSAATDARSADRLDSSIIAI